jgi:predicted PolB exonuclease-like 3'-5' exonuclease
MSNLFIDIESLPSEAKPDLSEIEPPKNYKDPEKIKKYQEEKLDEIYRKQALDSMQGRLLCLAWAIDDGPVESIIVGINTETEETLINSFQNFILNIPVDIYNLEWVGHNIKTFDLPWIWRKALKYRCFDLARIIPRQRYDKRIKDTMEMWAVDFKDYVSLDKIAKFLGLGGKEEGIDGSKVYDMWLEGQLEKIEKYCREDVELVREVYKIINV